jgi:hypothetical protein
MTQGRWGLGRPLGRPLKTSVHTQNIKVKEENCEPMENPYWNVIALAHRAKSVNLCANTGID